MFVGGLSAQTTLDDVRAYFEQYGQVSFRSDSGSGYERARTPLGHLAGRGQTAHINSGNY